MQFNTTFKNILTAAALATVSLTSLAQSALTATPFTALYVFGDSLSDSGNNRLALGFNGPNPTSNTFVPTFPYAAANTYSNGPTWVTGFASGLGLAASSQPSLAGGGDYAYGGAKTTGASGFPPSLQMQLSGYLATGPAVTPTTLYVIAGGGNDARAVGDLVAGGADLVASTTAGASTYANNTRAMVNQLRTAGAQNIVVWNVPDLGKTPAAGAGVGPAAAAGSFIANTFNSFLSTALAGSGVTIFDTFGLIDSVVANPAAFGFVNVTQACGFAGNGCNAATALFWDGIHPTAFAQNYIASRMLSAVPEPGTWLMFAAGGLVLVMVRRRQA